MPLSPGDDYLIHQPARPGLTGPARAFAELAFFGLKEARACLFAGLFFLLSLAAIISFISLYIYELPTHHCPFDMLQKSSNFIGYPIYLSLIGTTLCGTVPALLEVVRRVPSLEQIVALGQRRWLWMAMFFLAIFVLLTSWPIMFGRLTLHVYF